VAAGGNGGPDGKPVYPAALPTVIAVSATDSQDGLYAMSTPGKYIDVAAPGVDILSPAPGGSWQMVSGTSMAAAHVSAAVALILQNYPELSPFQVKYLLESSSVDLGEAGRDDKFGEGRIDVFEAIDELNDSAEARAQ
jgi:subtilisin family serine protease